MGYLTKQQKKCIEQQLRALDKPTTIDAVLRVLDNVTGRQYSYHNADLLLRHHGWREIIGSLRQYQRPVSDTLLSVLAEGEYSLDELSERVPSSSRNALMICISRIRLGYIDAGQPSQIRDRWNGREKVYWWEDNTQELAA